MSHFQVIVLLLVAIASFVTAFVPSQLVLEKQTIAVQPLPTDSTRIPAAAQNALAIPNIVSPNVFHATLCGFSGCSTIRNECYEIPYRVDVNVCYRGRVTFSMRDYPFFAVVYTTRGFELNFYEDDHCQRVVKTYGKYCGFQQCCNMRDGFLKISGQDVRGMRVVS